MLSRYSYKNLMSSSAAYFASKDIIFETKLCGKFNLRSINSNFLDSITFSHWIGINYFGGNFETPSLELVFSLICRRSSQINHIKQNTLIIKCIYCIQKIGTSSFKNIYNSEMSAFSNSDRSINLQI